VWITKTADAETMKQSSDRRASVDQAVHRDQKDRVTIIVQSQLMPCRPGLHVVYNRNSVHKNNTNNNKGGSVAELLAC